MAAMMQFDLVSPEKLLASFEASEIEIPGAEGDFTAMADHAALVTTMRPGVVKVTSASETAEYVVTGGFVEVSAKAISVLAEVAIPRGEITRADVEAMVSEAQSAATNASQEIKDAADKRLADTQTLAELLAL
jgi:F-type H+-transporting ATPase subunit epsilon